MLGPGAHERFGWHSFDMRSELPSGWQEDILEVVESRAAIHELMPTSVTSREADRATSITFSIVGGLAIARDLPWLDDLYRNRFRNLARSLAYEPVATAHDVQYGVTLNVQRGAHQSYECHVDSNPVQGLLYVTSHPEGSGGDLVVANHGDVPDREAVDADAARIYPVAGHLMFFDARQHSHYVAPLSNPNGIRVVAAMTYYTPSSTEAERPSDLKAHLDLEPPYGLP